MLQYLYAEKNCDYLPPIGLIKILKEANYY